MSTESRPRSAAETRGEILRAALEQFTEKGYEGTSVRDISRALGITQSSLYYHFASKEEIVATLMRDRVVETAELIDWIRKQPRGPGLLRASALRWIDRTTPERLTGMRLAQTNQPIIARIAGEQGDLRGAFRQVLDAVLEPDTSPSDKLYARVVFDTVNATLSAARGTGATDDDILEVSRRAVLALTADAPRGHRGAKTSVTGG